MFLPTVRHCHWQFEWAVTVSVFVFASVSVSVSVAVHPPIWERQTVRLSASRARQNTRNSHGPDLRHPRSCVCAVKVKLRRTAEPGVCSRSRCCIRNRSRRNAIFVAVAVAMTRRLCCAVHSVFHSVFRIPYFVFRGRGRHTMHVHKIRGNSETRSYDVDDVMSADSAFQCRHIKC